MDTTLTLGAVVFADEEVPAALPFGGEQRLSVHELIGGLRIIDAMGPAERAVEWAGWFIGPDAVQRAQYIDSLRVSGQPQTLAWSNLSYQVIVRHFDAEFQRFYQIPYKIVCEVISNQTQPVTTSPTPPIDQAIQVDALAAQQLAIDYANVALENQVNAMVSLIQAVNGFATAPQSAINGILPSLVAAQTLCDVLVTNTNAAIGVPTTFGGVVVGAAAASSAALDLATTNTLNLVTLYTLQGVLGRLDANLNGATSSPNTVSLAGGNLFQVAESQYGDATAWAAIAQANGLIDPFIQGLETLTIPTQPGDTGGIRTS